MINHTRKLIPFLFIVCALCGAQQPDTATLKHLTLEELSQIEVTSPTKQPEQAFRSPTAIYVITADQIRRSGATTIPEALRLAPGVEVARINANQWSIGIRGFGSRLARSVLVLIDGRIVYTALLAGTYWEVQDTMLEDIDRIEVIRGPGGSIWGPNAVNGVINIITKPARETTGILASAGGGNSEQGFANFRQGGHHGDDLYYRFYAKAFTRGPEYHSDHANYDDWRGAQGGFRVDWTANPRDSVTFQGDIYDQEDGQRVRAVTYLPPYARIVDSNASASGGDVLGRWRRVFDDGRDLQIQVSYDHTNRSEANFADYRDTADVDFIDRFRLPDHQQISWGLSARVSRGYNPPAVSGLLFVPERRTDQLYTAFLQDEIGIIPERLSLTVGSKLLKTNFTGFKLQPNIRLMWTPDNKNAAWAAFTHALRTPSDGDRDFALLGYIGQATPTTPYFARLNPNGGFVSEQLNGYEIGYRRLATRNLYFDVTAFYNHYHDLFSEDITGSTYLEPVPAPPHFLLPAQFANSLRGRSEGVEVAPEWKPASFWQIRSSYSYLNLNLNKVPGSREAGTAPITEGLSPRHQVAAESSWDLPKGFQFDFTYRYLSGLRYQHIPAYSTGDARLAWRFSREFELAVAGRNLFQPVHYEYPIDTGPFVGIERSAYIKLTWYR